MNILCTNRLKNPSRKKSPLFVAVLWLRIDFNADPVPKSQKVGFLHENIQVIQQKTYGTYLPYGTKALLKGRTPGSLVYFGQLLCSVVEP
jgi:hypothetical protein